MAKLYNISCIATDYPDLLSFISNLALRYFFSTNPTGPLKPSDLQLSGYHYFSNNTTPVFAFDALASPKLGTVYAAKGASSDVPSEAVVGVNKIGNGAVPWLFLTSRPTTEGDIKDVYRLNTAGGQPPEACTSMPAAFSVDYAAVYWFWK